MEEGSTPDEVVQTMVRHHNELGELYGKLVQSEE